MTLAQIRLTAQLCEALTGEKTPTAVSKWIQQRLGEFVPDSQVQLALNPSVEQSFHHWQEELNYLSRQDVEAHEPADISSEL